MSDEPPTGSDDPYDALAELYDDSSPPSGTQVFSSVTELENVAAGRTPGRRQERPSSSQPVNFHMVISRFQFSTFVR